MVVVGVRVTALFLLFVLSLCPTEPQNMCAWVEACSGKRGKNGRLPPEDQTLFCGGWGDLFAHL